MGYTLVGIIALRNEKGSYNRHRSVLFFFFIIALRNEKGSYNKKAQKEKPTMIIALRN